MEKETEKKRVRRSGRGARRRKSEGGDGEKKREVRQFDPLHQWYVETARTYNYEVV